jgi:4-alpha-glucanotransferase
LPFIAEDLGSITPDVTALLDRFHFPGSRVFQFAFDGHPDNMHLPHNYPFNTVVYTGTHDNATTRGWFEELPDHLRQNVWSYLKRPAGETDEIAWELIRLAWSSPAALAIVPLQDLLNLGMGARMNQPGRAEGELALALHGGHAVRADLSGSGALDEDHEPARWIRSFGLIGDQTQHGV